MRKIQVGGHRKIKNGKRTNWALVDDIDYKRLNKWNWCFNGRGYVIRRNLKGNGFVFMHREVINTPPKKKTDHINGNKLDNRRINLRIVTDFQNSLNKSARKRATSKYKGVYLHDKKKGWWRARIKKRGKTKHLGLFKNEKEAAKAYNQAAQKYFGEYAWFNKV